MPNIFLQISCTQEKKSPLIPRKSSHVACHINAYRKKPWLDITQNHSHEKCTRYIEYPQGRVTPHIIP